MLYSAVSQDWLVSFKNLGTLSWMLAVHSIMVLPALTWILPSPKRVWCSVNCIDRVLMSLFVQFARLLLMY